MKRQWIFLVLVLAALSMVMACVCGQPTRPVEQPVVAPPPPVQPKVEEVAPTPPPPPVEEAVKEVPPPPKIEEVALEDIYFAFDDYSLTDRAKATLDRNASWVTKNPNARVQIEGNCDERGTVEYNLALGEKRANSAKKYLVNMGIRETQLSTISYGKEKPIDPGHNEEAWAKNRRDHFTILK